MGRWLLVVMVAGGEVMDMLLLLLRLLRLNEVDVLMGEVVMVIVLDLGLGLMHVGMMAQVLVLLHIMQVLGVWMELVATRV